VNLADILRAKAIMEEHAVNSDFVEVPFDVWLWMNAIADALDGGDS
jgi:hypothetical protein